MNESTKRENLAENSQQYSGESAFTGMKGEFKCFECGKYGHKRAECPENQYMRGNQHIIMRGKHRSAKV